MRLTQWTDYTLRVLMYCASVQPREAPVTITEIAQSHAISRSHLTKIVQELGAMQLLETTRGRGGGIRLQRAARDINIGAVVRHTETDFNMVECFDPASNQCSLSHGCKLKSLLHNATARYLEVLDCVTLEDLLGPGVTTIAPPVSLKFGRALLSSNATFPWTSSTSIERGRE